MQLCRIATSRVWGRASLLLRLVTPCERFVFKNKLTICQALSKCEKIEWFVQAYLREYLRCCKKRSGCCMCMAAPATHVPREQAAQNKHHPPAVFTRFRKLRQLARAQNYKKKKQVWEGKQLRRCAGAATTCGWVWPRK